MKNAKLREWEIEEMGNEVIKQDGVGRFGCGEAPLFERRAWEECFAVGRTEIGSVRRPIHALHLGVLPFFVVASAFCLPLPPP